MLDALPDDGQRYEIIDGALHVTAGAGRSASAACRRVVRAHSRILGRFALAYVMVSPADVRKGDRTRIGCSRMCSWFAT